MKHFYHCFAIATLLTVVSAKAFATSEQKPNAKAQFFYQVPEEATTDWPYQIQECAEMNEKQKSDVIKCEKLSSHEACKTKTKISLQNMTNKKSQEFKVIYHVFKSKNECVADRESLLAEE